MFRGRRLLRSGTATVVAAATALAYSGLVVVSPPASAAADTPTQDVMAGLDKAIGFVDSLGAVGALADAPPGLSLVPGAPQGLGVTDLLSSARDSLGAAYGGATTLDQLMTKLSSIDNATIGDRKVTVTASDSKAGALHTITIGFTASRKADTGVDLASTSPKFSFTAGKGIEATLGLTGGFTVLYNETNRSFALKKDGSTPSLGVTIGTAIPDLSKVTAGLGILGAQLTTGSTYSFSAAIGTTFDDPDNSGTLGLDELTAAGAGAGLAHVSLTSAALSSTLNLAAIPSPYISLGSATASVTVGSPDLLTTPLTVTDSGNTLGAVNNFLNLSPRDLAQGLGELATSLVAMQRTGGVDLPFLRGSVQDAANVAEGIAEFLKANTAATTDPKKPGRPTFASLQEMLKALVDADTLPSAVDFTVTNGTYDGSKVRFDLGITKTGPARALNVLGAATTGSGDAVTYTANTVKDTTKNFSADPAVAASYVGRQIIAGMSSGLVQSVSGDTITLEPTPGGTADPWKGGIPAAKTAYSISAGDPKTGLVELGDVLKATGGIANANAKSAVASVTPSYSATLPLVLDLRPGPATTGPDADCNPDPAVASPCPFTAKDPKTGLATVITALPLPADRIMLHTGVPLLTADAPITTQVDVDATVGFVGIKITGELRACTTQSPADCTGTPASGTHLLSLGLKTLGDAQGDATFPQIGKAITDALSAPGSPIGTVLDTAVHGQAWAKLKVQVPGAGGFFPGEGTDVTVKLADITKPGDATVDAPDLGKLIPLNFDTDNPLALFGVLLADLQGLQTTLTKLPGADAALKTEIPLVGSSLSSLIGSGVSGGGPKVTYGATSLTDPDRTFDRSFIGRRVAVGTSKTVVLDGSGSTLTLAKWNTTPANGSNYEVDSEVQGVVNLLTAAPPASLQDALALLKNGLGIKDGVAGEGISFTVDTSGSDPVLKLDLGWNRDVAKTLPVSFDFDLAGTGKSLIGAAGKGQLKATVGGGVSLKLQLPLTKAAAADPLNNLKIDPASQIGAKVALDGTKLGLDANVGPFQVSLGDPGHPDDPGTELQAKFGVKLTDTADTGPVSLATFTDNMGITLDNGKATCSKAAASVDLAACAFLPVYLNGTLVGPAGSGFKLRLPKDATDVSDLFALTGTVGGEQRFEYPAGLDTALTSAGLNLLSLGDGLFAYIQFLENSLKVAAFDGKLPIVGKDLQAGSKFLEDFRTGLEGVLTGAGVPTNPTAGDIKDFLNTKVKPQLPGWPQADDLPIEFECNITLATAGQPTATPTNAGVETTTYAYKVVAYTNDPAEDGKPSELASVDVKNAAVLDGTHYNTVTWPKVDYATGYKLLRSVNGGDFLLAKSGIAPDANPSYTDNTLVPPAQPYSAVASNPKVTPCPESAPADSVTGFTVTVDLHQGNPTVADGCTDPDCLTAQLPLDLGIPGLSFKATDDSQKITGKLGWSLHLQFGLNRDDGFFVRTQDTKQPELVLGASLDLPANMKAQLAFINIDIAKHQGVTSPLFKGSFSIDLKDSAAATACPCPTVNTSKKLTFDKLKGAGIGDLVTPLLTAGVAIDWDLKANATSALPGIGAEFLLQWDWSSGSSPDDTTGLSKLGFKNVVIDPGAFIQGNIGPIISQLVSVFKPVQPIIDTILAPLPVLSDLSKLAGGDDVTIASLAQTFSTIAGGPDITPFIEVLKTIKSLSGLVGNCPGGGPATFCINIGDFDIKKTLALGTANSAATAASLVDVKRTGDNAFAKLNELSGNKLGAAGNKGDLTQWACPSKKRGLSFPALESPTSLFGLLLNQDVELACFDSGPLTLGFEMNLRLGPVYAPPPVYINISGGASVSLRIAAGFDTYGIRTAVESGKVDAQVLDSLYFKTVDTDGKPLPVVKFTGFLAAGASVSAVVIEVGVDGGIELTVNFTWNDPNNDGKFRFSEFLATALTNPICLFNVGGQLDLFIKVFITLGISPFSVSFDFELVRVKLLDFSLKPNCTPPPPRLGGTQDGVLYLFAGKFSGKDERGNDAWKSENKADESWIVRQVSDDPSTTEDERAVTVQALGISETFPDPGGSAISTVVLDGRGYQGKLKVVFNGGGAAPPPAQGSGATPTSSGQLPFDKKTVVFTGQGDDTVRSGSGESWIDGGPGADNLSATDRPDLAKPISDTSRAFIAGGAGKDTVTTGNGADYITGDNALGYTTTDRSATALDGTAVPLKGVIDVGSLGKAAVGDAEDTDSSGDGYVDDDDIISAGLGGAEIFGGAGADTIGTANDSPLAKKAGIANPSYYTAQKNTIVGGTGGDRIKSGSASDEIYTGSKAKPGKNGTGSGDAATDVNTVDTGTGSDTVYGSPGMDHVSTGSSSTQVATVYGGGAEDILAGGDGSDAIYGGPDDDYVIAEPATVDTDPTHKVPDVLGSAYVVKRLVRPSSDSPKTLVGGGGHDRIYGGNGNAKIYGDREDFTCNGGAAVPSDAPTEAPESDDASDLILGGDGVDRVNAGGGDDYAYGKGAADLLCGNAGKDKIYAGLGADQVWGGSGDDTAFGDDGADALFGNADKDTLYGGSDADVLEGNDDVDTLYGGTSNDVLVGGTRASARADKGDFLYGDSGNDTLLGDNGVPGTLYDLDANNDGYGGDDVLYGGDGDDTAYGELAKDEVHGNADNDQLEGNNDVDKVYGEAGYDNIIGGTSQLTALGATYPDAGDLLYGGDLDDVIAGDNAVITSVDSGGTDITQGRGLSKQRLITLHDVDSALPTKSGDDKVFGGKGTDVLLGEGATDTVHGDEDDDYAEGGQGGDTVHGDAGEDDLVGGSFWVLATANGLDQGTLDGDDTVYGGDSQDVALGDNGKVLRGTADKSDTTKNRGAMTPRKVVLLDLGDSPRAGTSGRDFLLGEGAADVLYGQSGSDRVLGGDAEDYLEGGPASDWLEGMEGDDDLVGGSSTPTTAGPVDRSSVGQKDAADVIWGGNGDDLAVGDNAVVDRQRTPNELTYRIGTNPAGTITDRRALDLLDLNGSNTLVAPSGRSGGDWILGGDGVDVLLGQDGDDKVSGGSADDYVEGQGGADTVNGDEPVTGYPDTSSFVGSASTGYDADNGLDGQDDLIGGKSEAAFRDGNDTIHGDGASDFVLGDNGTAVRKVTGTAPSLTDTAYLARYKPLAQGVPVPATFAKVRVANSAFPSSRFCDSGLATTCERAGAFGADTLFGDGGDDFAYGQDGDDQIRGGDNDDDLYGELGNDRVWGDAGEDAILGDRGGIRDRYENGASPALLTVNQVPKVEYQQAENGTVTRVVDLLHDVNGDVFVGSGAGSKMPHNGMEEGGDDRLRGGLDNDAIHAGFGDDLANGDSGGDVLFGDDGADVMWGGKGCDQQTDTPQSKPFCFPGGVFDPAPHNAQGETIQSVTDYLFGGKGGTSAASVASASGSDVLDWRPRGLYTDCVSSPWPADVTSGKGKSSVTTTKDPCAWFEMTNTTDDLAPVAQGQPWYAAWLATTADNQHHGGVDWQYGGWDRDVLQGDVADNGPNEGDRLLDWNGAYNLYTHCNSAYGGYNDVRQHSPSWQDFLQKWAYSEGAGQQLSDTTTGTPAPGTSAYDELALVYPGSDNDHGSGSAYPSTPGHFENPNACTS